MSRAAEPRPCAAPFCCSPVKPGQLMCKVHWLLLPEALQRAVLRSWKTYRRWAGHCDRPTQIKHLNAYRDAVDAAVRHHDPQWTDALGNPVQAEDRP